ncbi:MAG TPA: ChbG/HpnK family deacetylase [Thermoleophilaceae bacterium]
MVPSVTVTAPALPYVPSADRAGPAARGLLIVNADDWGGYPEMTDAAHRCFQAGAVTSATAMVYMRDSERAADIALYCGIPIGLHLNLTRPFSDPATPPDVRSRQHELSARFRRRQLRRWTYDPRLRGLFEHVIFDQLERFHELYGRPPDHIDGHEHAHLAFNVIFSRALEKGTAFRGGGPVGGSLARQVRRMILRQRFRTPDLLLAFECLLRRWDSISVDLSIARHSVLEVSSHPGWTDSYARLMSPEWADALAGHRLGSFADLAAPNDAPATELV